MGELNFTRQYLIKTCLSNLETLYYLAPREMGTKGIIMKKIIDGKKYDTETATLIGTMENGYNCGDFHYTNEELYQKKNGEFFLFGEGGALSIYGEKYGNGRCGSRQIIPYFIEEAQKWVAEHCGANDYEKFFGEVEE